jgi:hypothetical protein
VYALPPVYYYIRGPLLACRRQVESLVLYPNLPHCPLLPVTETVLFPSDLTTSQREASLYPFHFHHTRLLYNSRYSLRAHCIGGDTVAVFLEW